MIQGIRGSSPTQILRQIGRRAQARRLGQGRTQESVARAAGLSRPTVARFEAGKAVDFEAVVRIAIALDAEDAFAALFAVDDPRSLDEIVARESSPRRRGRTTKPKSE